MLKCFLSGSRSQYVDFQKNLNVIGVHSRLVPPLFKSVQLSLNLIDLIEMYFLSVIYNIEALTLVLVLPRN